MPKKKTSKAKKDKFKLSVEGPCDSESWKNKCTSKNTGCNCGGAFYGLGFLGAAIYYISTATSFWIGVLGILKAIVWPAFVIFELMKFLGM